MPDTKRIMTLTFWCSLPLLGGIQVLRADVIYVNAAAPPGGDGRSWQTAYDDLQPGLRAALPGDELWVARGRYTPERPDGNRWSTFHLRSGVALYGGFAGTEQSRDQRDPDVNETVLSGDLNGDDGDAGPRYSYYRENTYHVVTLLDANRLTLLDGVTIHHGYADGGFPDNLGAGVAVLGGSPRIAGCEFFRNVASDSGGGLYVEAAQPKIDGCLFFGNHAAVGGGAFFHQGADATVTDTVFQYNEADLAGGGAAAWGQNTHVTWRRCSFTDNIAPDAGGAMFNVFGARIDIDDSLFTGNFTERFGGAVYSEFDVVLAVRTSEFVANAAGLGGAAIANTEASAVDATDCRFERNRAVEGPYWWRYGGAVINSFGAKLNAASCTFRSNEIRIGYGGAVANVFSAEAKLRDCLFDSNTTNWSGGGLYNAEQSSVDIFDCTWFRNATVNDWGYGGAISSPYNSADLTITGGVFEGNSAAHGGAVYSSAEKAFVEGVAVIGNQTRTSSAIDLNLSVIGWVRNSVFAENTASREAALSVSNADVIQCQFIGNYAEGVGGALRVSFDSTVTDCAFTDNESGTFGGAVVMEDASRLVNCLLSGNRSGSGGAVYSAPGHAGLLVNCVLADNTASVAGGGIYVEAARPTLTTCVFFDNTDQQGNVESSQIRLARGGLVSIDYSCVQGWTGNLGGEGNFGDDPLFQDREGGNYRLRPGSPCIDAGDNLSVPQELTTDLDGLPRFVDDRDTPDRGRGDPPIVDIGAYEFQAVATGRERLKAVCRSGENAQIRATLKHARPDIDVTFRLDGRPETDRPSRTGGNGTAKVTLRKVEVGDHRVLVLEVGVQAQVACE